MPCHPIKPTTPRSTLRDASSPSDNASVPNKHADHAIGTAYVCDTEAEWQALQQQVKPANLNPSAWRFGAIAQNDVKGRSEIPEVPFPIPRFGKKSPVRKKRPPVRVEYPRPKTPIARILYDVASQLDEFEMHGRLHLPVMDHYSESLTHADIRATIGNNTALLVLDAEFIPSLGPMPPPVPVVREIAEHVPILGLWARVRILKVRMDPKTRHVKARIGHIILPVRFNYDLQSILVEKGDFPKRLEQGAGYDLKKGVPLYTWQVAALVEDFFTRKKGEALDRITEEAGIKKFEPMWDRGQIHITGKIRKNFFNIANLRLRFHPQKQERPRFQLTGDVMNPVLTVWGVKSIAVTDPAKGIARMSLHSDDPHNRPMQIHLHLNKDNMAHSSFTLPYYKTGRLRFQATSTENGRSLGRIMIKSGVVVEGLRVGMTDNGPTLSINRLSAEEISVNALGVRFQTDTNTRAALHDLHLETRNGRPMLRTRLRSRATGQVLYVKGQEELGWINFKKLDGEGYIYLGPEESDPSKDNIFRMIGKVHAAMPELGLMVRSKPLQAQARTIIEDAQIYGDGVITVWPKQRRALISNEGGQPVTIEGNGGTVWIHQDPSALEGWSDLREKIGEDLAKHVVTNLYVDLSHISFSARHLDVQQRMVEGRTKPILDINRADLGPIDIQGNVYGQIFAKLPVINVFHPIVIPEEAMMRNAVISLRRLVDSGDDNEHGHRNIMFRRLFLSGRESQATFSKKDQARCGIDRQWILADLDVFEFSPKKRHMHIENVREEFRLHLKNPPAIGGCVKVE